MSILKADNGEILEVKEAIVLNSKDEPIHTPTFDARDKSRRFQENFYGHSSHVKVYQFNGLLGLIFPLLFLAATLIFMFALGGSLFTFLLVGWAGLTLLKVFFKLLGLKRNLGL